MPKSISERIIDYPESAAGRASPYSAGGTATTTTLPDHTHSGGLNQGGDLALYLLADGTRTAQELRFDTTPTPSETVGSVAWNVDRDTLDIYLPDDVTLQVGQEVHFFAINKTGAPIPDGAVVMFDPANTPGNSGIIACQLAVADGTYPATMVMGVATHAIADDATGKITFFGEVRGLDTSAWAEGDILYIDPATPGGLTNVAPDAPNLRYAIAVVITDSATVGEILVRAIYSTSVSGADDVYLNGGPFDGNVLRWDGTDARWENEIAVTRHEIPTAQTYTVPALHHYNVAHPYLYVDGDLDVIGDVVIHNPGGKADSIVTTAVSYTASAADDYVVVTGISGNVTITLPLAANAQHAIEIIRADSTAYTVTVVGTSSQTINGETSQTLRRWDAMKCVPVSSYWLIG